MAGDWIKVEKSTPRKMEVMIIAGDLGIDADQAFGLCFRFWSWCDDNLTTGNAPSVTETLLDALLGRSGFAKALLKVGWLRVRNGSLEVPNFDRHLSQSAKSRALTAGRVAKHKAEKGNAPTVTKTLLEKRREDTKKERESVGATADVDLENVRLMDSVIAAYPKNGNAMEAKRALALLNSGPNDLQAILAQVQTLAAKMAILPESERRFCPTKHTFFSERRWNDDPGGWPWTFVPGGGGGKPSMPPLKPGKWSTNQP